MLSFDNVRKAEVNGRLYVCVKDVAQVVGCGTQTLSGRLRRKGCSIIMRKGVTGLPIGYALARQLPHNLTFSDRLHTERYAQFVRYLHGASTACAPVSYNEATEQRALRAEIALLRAEVSNLTGIIKEVYNRG